MGESIVGIKISELPEASQSQITDTNVMVVDNGTATRKTKLSTLISYLKSKMIKNSLTQATTGYALDATQGKKLKEEVDALNSALTEKFAGFHTYDITDYQETDDKIKQVVDYYIEHNVDTFEIFFMRITLQKGSTFIVNGYKHDAGYATATVTGYSVKNPLYGRRIAGKWTWNTISVA